MGGLRIAARGPRGGTALNGAGHGTVLAGRYRLEERLSTGMGGTLWRAVDETLDRPVRVQVLPSGHAHTDEVVDAARRVALVEDPRLVRPLAAGTEGTTGYVVLPRTDGLNLAETLRGGPLDAETARRLVGEAAQALARAGDRGLNHQFLLPESLVIGPDGGVSVTGTAVEAATADLAQQDSVVARRRDAVGLVQVLYAGLTGRWPGERPSSVPAAPRSAGRHVPPADLLSGVPGDLNTLCTTTLGSDGAGPYSPEEVARELAPWTGGEPLTAPNGLLLAPTRPGAVPPQAEPTPEAEPTPGATPTQETTATQTPAATVPHPSPAPGAVPAPVPASAVGAPLATTTAPTTSAAPPSVPVPPAPAPADRYYTSADTWAEVTDIGIPVESEDTLVPFVAPVPMQRPPEEQSRFVITVVIGFVAVVLVVAAFSLRNFGSGGEALTPDPTHTLPTSGPTTAVASAPATAGASPSASPPASPSASATPDIAGIQALDPQGDGSENDARAGKAIDRNPDTEWKSNHYATASFAELKDGLGLALRMGDETPVQQVTVEVRGSGGTVELRTASGPGLDGSAVVATAEIDGGHVALTPARPVTSRWLVVWFTKLPKVGSRYQLFVSEIGVR